MYIEKKIASFIENYGLMNELGKNLNIANIADYNAAEKKCMSDACEIFKQEGCAYELHEETCEIEFVLPGHNGTFVLSFTKFASYNEPDTVLELFPETAKKKDEEDEEEDIDPTGNLADLIKLAVTLQAEKKDLSKQLKALRKEIDAQAKQSGSDVGNHDDVLKENERLNSELTLAKENANNLSAELKEKENMISQLETALVSAAAESKNASDGSFEEITKRDKAIKDLNAQVASLEKTCSEQEAKIAEYETRTETLKNVSAVSSDAPASVLDEKAHEELRRLAYTDVKFGTMNTNAFNRDLKALSKETGVVAQVNICDMKHINEVCGRSAGDKLIKTVAGDLVEHFDEEHVYRMYGDQFFILKTDGDESSLYAELDLIRQKLDTDKIKVVFAVTSYNKYKSAGALVNALSELCSNAKQAKDNYGGERPKYAPKVEEDNGYEDVDIDELIAAKCQGE